MRRPPHLHFRHDASRHRLRVRPAVPYCATSAAARSDAVEVCDAHPELMRAAQCIGSRPRRRVPGLRRDEPTAGVVRVRRQAEAGERPGDQQRGRAAEARRLSCDEFACYDVEVLVECRWNHLRRQSLHGRLHVELTHRVVPDEAEVAGASRRDRPVADTRPTSARGAPGCDGDRARFRRRFLREPRRRPESNTRASCRSTPPARRRPPLSGDALRPRHRPRHVLERDGPPRRDRALRILGRSPRRSTRRTRGWCTAT